MQEFLARDFAQMKDMFEIVEVPPFGAKVRMRITHENLRPGGTVSGPSMFTAVDCAFYIAILAMIGPKALAATTNCTINFMRKPAPADLIAEVKILKLGKVLCVGDVMLYSEGMADPVAHATLTYSISKSI